MNHGERTKSTSEQSPTGTDRVEGIISKAHTRQQTGTAPATTAEEEIRLAPGLFP